MTNIPDDRTAAAAAAAISNVRGNRVHFFGHGPRGLRRGVLTSLAPPTADLHAVENFASMLESLNGTIDPSEQLDNERNKFYLYVVPSLIFFCIVSVAVNIKILASIYWIRRPLSPTLHISLSLAGADAFSSVILGIGLVINSFIPHGLEVPLNGIFFTCFELGLEAVRVSSVIITVAHLTALAVNHYLGILKPLHHLSIMTRRNTSLLIVLLWILPLAVFFVYFSFVENEGFRSEECKTHSFLRKKKFRLMFSSLFICPFVLMVFIYTHIFHIVREQQGPRLHLGRAGSLRRSTRGGGGDGDGGCDNEVDDNGARQSSTQQMAKNVKAIHTTLYILGSYAIGWMPGVIVYVLFCEDCFRKMSDFGVYGIAIYGVVNFLIILKTLMNPIIYAARMHEIKMASKRMHASFRGCFGAANAEGVAAAAGRGSEGNRSNRTSVPRSAGGRRLNDNADIRNPRNDGPRYTCPGNRNRATRNTTVL